MRSDREGRGIARTLLSWLAAVALALLAAAPAAAQIPPDARWRTLDTPHFRVNYVEGLEPLARHAADRAEHAYALLAAELPHAPRGKIDLMLADNVDFANGYATPLPTNRIVVYAHPPADLPELSFYADWVELVVLHELVHIFHLDTSRGIWADLRRVIGRDPSVFPELYSPSWVKEGLAVYYESRLTPTGRLRGTQFDMALRTAVLGDAFLSIDQASADPVLWPDGSAAYIYGASFLDFLSRRYGRARIPEFVARGAGEWIPFLRDRPARAAFGVSFTRAWGEWRESLRARYRAQADSIRALGLTEPEILTREGRGAAFPRYAPRGGAIAYAASTGRDEPELRLILPDGTVRGVVPRTTLGPAAWTPDGGSLLFSQLDYADPYRVYSGLYLASASAGGARRVGGVERVWEADLDPSGSRAVGVMDAGGTNVLARVEIATGRVRALTRPEPGVQWSLPRWSPRGDLIAVGRWTPGGFYDVVLVDTAGAVVRALTHDRAVDEAPAWSPDGRWVIFSSDRTGIPNLFACDLQDGRLFQVTRVLTGATQPDVSPDARWIAFSLYRADGYHVARLPFDPSSWRPAPVPSDSLLAAADTVRLRAAVTAPSRPYSPFPTLLPSSWLPSAAFGSDLGLRLGALVGGTDAVERHLWAADAAVYPDGGRFDGGAGYVYRGLGNPTLAASLSQRWDVLRASGPGAAGGPPESAALRRERDLELSASWLRQRWRSAAWVATAAELDDLYDVWKGPPPAGSGPLLDRPPSVGASLTGGYSSARGYAFSIGPEEGVRLTSTVEGRRYTRAFPGETDARGYLRSVTHLRGYLPLRLGGFARHVLAARVDLGLDRGRGSPGFDVGGASGGSAPLPLELEALGGGISFPVRGYPEGAQLGTRALALSAEYRFPIALVQRGIRVLPVFLDRIHGDLFADAGTACLAGDCVRFTPTDPAGGLLTSVGAELTLGLQVGFGAPLPLRFGLAQPLDPDFPHHPRAYVRVGRSF